MNAHDLLNSICDENLGVYRASPIRLREDVGQEAEIAHDYRGRLVYELLQNADDAMADAPSNEDSVFVRLTDTDLWVGNSGRALDEDDVRGLCGIGASSKGRPVQRKRASIGHKGMGFKSVLEITDAPEAISETIAFRLGRRLAIEPVTALMRDLGEPPPVQVPAMRFPSALERLPREWHAGRAAGLRTLFRFPLRSDLTADQRGQLADRLVELPVTAILFLKHLERIHVEVQTSERTQTFEWVINRTMEGDGDWSPVAGLSQTGLYRVEIDSRHSDHSASSHTFLIAHADDLEIGDHRGGLDEYAWHGVELSEVSVAVALVDDVPVKVRPAAQVLHVFLPTGELCPYSLVVNGAFSADLSRQEIRVSPDRQDYNTWLLSQAADVLTHRLVPALLALSAKETDVLRVLDRGADEPGEDAPTPTAQALVDAVRSALSAAAIVPTPSGHHRSLSQIVVPPLVEDDEAGSRFRSLLADDAALGELAFPVQELCAGRAAFVLADHGATALAPSDAPGVLADADLSGVELELHESELVFVDPVLRTLERFWNGLGPYDRAEFEIAVREAALFPTDGDAPGDLRRVPVADRECFYPPRALSGAVPLEGLCFLSRDLCWGDLARRDRQEVLHDQIAIWQALFGVRDFKFPDVMRGSVLPALTLPGEGGRPEEWRSLCRLEIIAAVCQLSGRTPSADAPLPYERLGPNRGLFNLARLPVPCRVDDAGEPIWRPAYRVYFGRDWIGDASVENVIDAIRASGREAPDIPFLAGPDTLVPLLQRYEDLRRSAEEEDEEDEGDEVDLEEDDEQALDADHRERWISFLAWLGVSHALRPVHFFDVEDREAGWTKTKNLAKPRGWAFQGLDDAVWTDYVDAVRRHLKRTRDSTANALYFYELYDLEFLPQLLGPIADDPGCDGARALLAHLAENWSHLQRFSNVTVASLPPDLVPNRRSKPPKAYAHELLSLGDSLWLHRLRQRDFLPTTHGPKRPAATWMPTTELRRRFSSARGKLDAGQLLPVLDADDELVDKARKLCSTLGVRGEMASSTFGPEDARTVLDRVAALFGHGSADGSREPDRASVREAIRPTYRNLVELLPGDDEDGRFPAGALAGAPLLEEDGHGAFRFVPSTATLWSGRNGTRERLGNPSGLWTFVLDASARPGPLTRLLRVRILEEELHWQPDPGDPALEGEDLTSFREGVRHLAPFILARLSADRASERDQSRDAGRMRRLMAGLEPVQELGVGCRFEERELALRAERSAFVQLDGNQPRAFVRWGESSWPPSAEEAEALAAALAETFGAGFFEAFLALASAGDDHARRRLLALAGATSDVEAFALALSDSEGAQPDDEASPEPGLELPKDPGARADEQPIEPPGPQDAAPITITPLYAPEDLLIDGAPINVSGDDPANGSPSGRRRTWTQSGGEEATRGYGGRTDLSALDALGMFVAMTYERNRLRSSGLPDAALLNFAVEANQPDACVFDISSPALIAVASQRSEPFQNAMAWLTAQGVHAQHPGCDILTLRPSDSDPIDRLIELKSSGQHARTQAMTWNEWKTAQKDRLRSRFYLYLVANLRSDLPDARPFVRAVRDPFATIRAAEQVDNSTTRRVVLRVAEFDHAEHLDLGVASPRRTSEHGKPTSRLASSETPAASTDE